MIGKILGRRRILSDREQELRAREQELLERVEAALRRFESDVEAEDLERLREARESLAGLFLLVIAGEFNAGKSSFINALLGERVLPEGSPDISQLPEGGRMGVALTGSDVVTTEGSPIVTNNAPPTSASLSPIRRQWA